MTTNNKQSVQQYQLKLGIIHHPSLKTIQLIEFLENQANQFLHNDLPQYIKGDQRFVNIMQTYSCQNQQLTQYSFEQYVGLILIYSTSSQQSYQYFLKNVQLILSLQISDLFLIVVQMDNSDKQANLIGNQGQKLCSRNGIQFVRLTLYNSQDLTSLIHRSLYELIENYYYPNEQLQENNINRDPNEVSISNQLQNPGKSSRQKSESNNRSSSRQRASQQFVFTYEQNNPTIKAFTERSSPDKQKFQQMLSHAISLRKSRQIQFSMEQQQLDESIQNVQNVLNNINHRIKEKLESGWFTSIKNNLYKTTQKNNANFSKIKLTQQFIDEIPQKSKKSTTSSVIQSRYSDVLNKSTKNFALNFNTLKFDIKTIKNPLLRIVLFFSRQNVIQLDVYEHSTYQQLASIALKRMGIRQTQKNLQIMMRKIRQRVQSFSRQFQRAIKINEQKKVQERSFLKSKINQQ